MKNKKTLIIAIVAILVVAGAVAGTILFMNSNKKAEDQKLIEQIQEELSIDSKVYEEDDDEDMNRAVIKDNGNSQIKQVVWKKQSPNKGTRTHVIDTISINTISGQPRIENLWDVYSKANSTNGSVHYAIDGTGDIANFVDEKDVAWTNGNKPNDNRAINILVTTYNDSYSTPYYVEEKTINSLIDLLVDVCKRNGIEKLVWSTDSNERKNHLNGANITCQKDFRDYKISITDYLYGRMGEITEKVNARLGSN